MLGSFLFGFLVGVVALVAAEAWAVLWLLARLGRKRPAPDAPPSQAIARDLSGDRSLAFPDEKKGSVWVLEPEKIPKFNSDESPTRRPKDQKNKSIVEVIPVKKYAKMKDQLLILSDSDGSKATIQLLGRTVVAVSASDLPSRKWAKRYPIKLESKDSVIYKGSKTCYLYFETSWEKESWCRALRLASCPDRGKWKWYTEMGEDFQEYLSSLNSEYPFFLKPSMLLAETTDRSNKIDGSSKVRHFLKKLAKKASKNGLESRLNSFSLSNYGERKIGEKLHSTNDTSSSDASVKCPSEDKFSSNSSQDKAQNVAPTSIHFGNKSLLSSNLDLAADEKLLNDEGTLCWNLLFSRLFFDAKKSIEINNLIKARIQRTLSNMRTPGYIGEVTCTGLDLGSLPPYIHRMRVFPMDLNEVWSMEVDIEYSGGIVLDVETRLEVREPELQKDIIQTSLEPDSTGEVNSDFLDGIEQYGNQLKSSSKLATGMDNKNELDKTDGLRSIKSGSWTSNYVSRWKAILHSLADQVSQVPLSLAIQVASLRGTLRLHIKPPPSDQLWFGFTTMPQLDWNLDSSVGDRKIASSHIALLIGNRFKAAIRDTLVLPNCESICIPWMLAEKDDWVPRKVAPFIWINNESMDLTGPELSMPQAKEDQLNVDSSNKSKVSLDEKVEKVTNVIHVEQPAQESFTSDGLTGTAISPRSSCDSMSTELKTPLLSGETERYSVQSNMDVPRVSSSMSIAMVNDRSTLPHEEDERPKRTNSSRRARMMDFGKRMGDKLEEKRRHIEEKGRHIVEKMRENART
ncbi:hypothetical protein Cni_G27730 [Canna indica]|uniref:SMP-LTD domain-containing protein n=1 Tax=Canna indica TaxID=4628 RepID=A0AAQ3L1B5_9LILI|nr:hypothetical protein Cni_G27730 [Canna indica]